MEFEIINKCVFFMSALVHNLHRPSCSQSPMMFLWAAYQQSALRWQKFQKTAVNGKNFDCFFFLFPKCEMSLAAYKIGLLSTSRSTLLHRLLLCRIQFDCLIPICRLVLWCTMVASRLITNLRRRILASKPQAPLPYTRGNHRGERDLNLCKSDTKWPDVTALLGGS